MRNRDPLHQNVLLRLMPLLVGVAVLWAATAVMAGDFRLPFAPAGGPPRLSGTQLGGITAPDFELADQNDAPVRLSALRGKAVSLSFLYTNCPDVCPVTAAKLLAAYDKLPKEMQSRVEILAVTVDPRNDNRERRADFVRAQGLDGMLRFLGGEAPEVSKVWSAYHIGVTLPQRGLTTVIHNSITYLIDTNGREQAFIDDKDFTPDELAANFEALLAPSATSGSEQAP